MDVILYEILQVGCEIITLAVVITIILCTCLPVLQCVVQTKE